MHAHTWTVWTAGRFATDVAQVGCRHRWMPEPVGTEPRTRVPGTNGRTPSAYAARGKTLYYLSHGLVLLKRQDHRLRDLLAQDLISIRTKA